MTEKNNEKLLNAWNNFQKAFHNDLKPSNSDKDLKFKNLLTYNSQSRPKSVSYKSKPPASLPRPISTKSNSNQYISNMISFKSLLNLKACSRPTTRPSTALPKSQSKHFEILNSISENKFQEIVKKAEKIHSLQSDEILDIYSAKCQDQEVEYLPDQAVVFIEKFKLNCGRRILKLSDLNLGLESAIVLGRILSQNNYFSRIELQKNLLSNAGVIVIADSIKNNLNIVHIDLTSNSIGVEGAHAIFGALLENESIISLNMSSYEGLNRNRIGNKGVEPLEIVLKNNKTLQFLHLASIGISIDGFRSIEAGLKGNRNLVYFDISNNDLGWQSASILNSIIEATCIGELCFSLNSLGDKGIEILSKTFRPNEKLSIAKFDISNNNISSQGISKFLESTAKNPSLVDLNLSKNNFSGKGIATLRNFLSENTSLIKLTIKDCNIDSEGAVAIGIGLSKNNMLQELIAPGNFFRDSGIKSIASGMGIACKKLVKLDLSKNRINDEGGIVLVNAIIESQTLKCLIIKENNFHDEMGINLVYLVKQHTGIIKLNINRNAISYKYIEDISKQLKNNNIMINRQKTPNYLNKMLELREFQGQKDVIAKENTQLKTTEKILLDDIDELRDLLHKTKEDENAKTKVLEDKLQEELDNLKEFEILREDTEKESQDFNMDCDVEYKMTTTAIGNINSEIAQTEFETKKAKEELQYNKLTSHNQIEALKKELQEATRLAQISESGYTTFDSKVNELKKNIEVYNTSIAKLTEEGYTPQTKRFQSNVFNDNAIEEEPIIVKKRVKSKKGKKLKKQVKK